MELLIVVSLLVTLAGIGVANYDSVDEDEREKLTLTALRELANAVTLLHADTGHWAGADSNPVHTSPYDWAVLTETDGDLWDVVSQRGWRGPYLIRQNLVQNVTVAGGANIGIDGGDSGSSADVDLPATALLDPHGGPFVLLSLNHRNVIVSRGKNGVFDELPRSGTAAAIYASLCASTIASDDMVICP